MFKAKLALFLILFTCFTIGAKATHIIGGSFSMKYISAGRYAISLDYYRDCKPGSVDFPPGSLRIGIYDKAKDSLIQTADLRIVSTQDVDFINGDCISLPTNCVQKRVYSDTVLLSANKYRATDGYYISYEQCCRNGGIKNIMNPQTSGIAFYMEFPAIRLSDASEFINSSPHNENPQNVFLCNTEFFAVDYKFIDDDGDSLVYKMIEPLKGNTDEINNNATGIQVIEPGPYPTIDWSAGYSMSNILDGTPDVSIDVKTGMLTVVPTQIGLYSLAFVVEEYRKGVKIGEIRNELQYYVSNCPVRTPPEITWLNADQDFIESNKKTCLNFIARDIDLDTLSAAILNVSDQLLNKYTIEIDTVNEGLNIQVCFDVKCNFIEYENLGFDILVSDNSCPLPKLDTLNLLLKLNGLKEGDPFKSIPNVFSPNDDGKNDFFYIKGELPNECIEDFFIKIYNRWGKLIFESTDFSFKWIGDDHDPGVYFYVVKINNKEGTGNLMLLH